LKLTGELDLAKDAKSRHANLKRESMGLFNLKLSQLARQLRHTFKALQCHMGVSENWILEATALHDIQQEPKTGQHPLEKLNVISNFCLRRSGKEQGHELNE
jgi:hypothetical protein